MRRQKLRSRSAFSLLELSIVILIIAMLAASGLTIFKSNLASSKSTVTKEKMDAVYKAMGAYLITNRKLPCPASLELVNSNANYGVPVGSDGDCSGTGIVISSANTNLAYGMVPTKSLGLSSDYAEDGFKTKFSYIVDKRFTAAVDSAGTTGFEGSDGNASMIEIRELSSGTTPALLTNGILVIISHGSNKLGGFNSAGTSQNPTTGIVADETTNIRASDFDSIFVTNSSTASFDDILIFKNKIQLAIDSGFEDMLCRGAEANYSSFEVSCVTPGTLTWNSTNYGEKKNSTATCPGACVTANPNGTNYSARVCGKYGIWGPVIYPCY